MTSSRIRELLAHPLHASRLIAYRIYELTHPNEPWLAQGAVRFCDRELDRDAPALEWGSGRSTTWFARRVRRLTSIEYQREWYENVRKRLLQKRVQNVDLRHVALDHPADDPTPPTYAITPAYVRVAEGFEDASLGLVVIDGHYRQACVLAALLKIRAGGLLLIDNTDRMPLAEWGVPRDWTIVHQSRNVRTQTTIWRKPV